MENRRYQTQDATYIVKLVIAYGHAARGNRGRYSGQKVHRLVTEQIVDVEGTPRAGTMGAQFLLRRKNNGDNAKPIYFSVYPSCGCTMGQHAGMVDERLTKDDVTCGKCSK